MLGAVPEIVPGRGGRQNIPGPLPPGQFFSITPAPIGHKFFFIPLTHRTQFTMQAVLLLPNFLLRAQQQPLHPLDMTGI